jgi:hypothetical protein
MSSLVERAIREPEVESAREYARRVHGLAMLYTALFICSAAGLGLVIWQAQLYVTLSQRSNVETLTLAFLLVFFAYLMLLSLAGTLGAARIAWFVLLAWAGPSPVEAERRKTRALPPQAAAGNPTAAIALNIALELDGAPHRPFSIPIEDPYGSLGRLVVDGAEITHEPATKDGSNTVLAYFTRQVNQLLAARGAPAGLEIMEWRKINDEETDKYLGLVRFARNLERRLDADELWPKRVLTAEDHAELGRRLAAVCPAMRNEAFLPHWEYAGEHKLPLIPEPLGLISLTRSEKRVDPLASMGCAVMIVVALVAILILIFIWPPWVPGM